MASSAGAQIYVGVSDGGSGAVFLSNHPSNDTPTLLLMGEPSKNEAGRLSTSTDGASQPLPGPLAVWRQPSPSTAELIRRVARDFAVGEALIKAIIAAESGFKVDARSPKGAIGLMQLMPQTAKRFGVRDAYAVEDNLRGGTAYIRWLLDLFDGDLRLALAAYNAGENAVMRAGWRVPDITETRAYVPKVLAYLAHFESQSKVHPR
jgi:soluble lytic murein transglycosylase-like protein